MDSFLFFWIAIIVIFFLIAGGLIFLAYWLPKRRGKRKLGIALAIITGLILYSPILSFFLEDYWFFKVDVTEALKEHCFNLTDDFEIKTHEITGLSDYYEQFIIELSENDKRRLIDKIQNSSNYEDKRIEKPLDNIYELPRYSNDKKEVYTWNYRTEDEFGFKYYKPRYQGQAPVNVIITIPENGNTLKHELIYD